MPGFVAAIANYAQVHGLGPLPRGQQFNQLMMGLRNRHGPQNTPEPKISFTMANLLSFLPFINRSTFEGARDWCACMLAFFGLLRVNEYMNGGLRHRHVRPHPQGVSITIPYSKTDLSEVTIDIARRGDDLCPSRALAQYFAFFAAHSSLPQLPDDPLFITRQQYAFATMTDGDFLSVVRSYIRAAMPGANPQHYGGHSFRRGGASVMKAAGVSDSLIKQHGRWRSDAFLDYLDSRHQQSTRLLPTQTLNAAAARSSS